MVRSHGTSSTSWTGTRRRATSELVAMLRTGPPWMHRNGPLATANVNENFVHHEDVRRPAGEAPRDLDEEMEHDPLEGCSASARAWQAQGRSRALALTMRRRTAVETTVTTDGAPVVLQRRRPASSRCSCSGRKDAAVVTVDGPDEAIAVCATRSVRRGPGGGSAGAEPVRHPRHRDEAELSRRSDDPSRSRRAPRASRGRRRSWRR